MTERIIPFNEGYLDAVYEIEKISFGDPWSKNAFLDSINSPFTEIYIALDSTDALCGYIAVNIIAPDCEILNLAVNPECRRRGVADSLLTFLFDKAKDMECDVVMLDVRESNAPAIALYEKHGFYKVGVRKRYYAGPVEDALLMDRNL